MLTRSFTIPRGLGAALVLFSVLAHGSPDAGAEPSHAIAMHGTPKYPADFSQFDYVNPEAPKGGDFRLHAIGTFDTLNPYVIKGKPAAGLHHGFGYFFETLTRRSRDEPFSLYGLLAESIDMADDRGWIEFTLRAEARFSDDTPVTVDDVIFSWGILKENGSPNARATWSRVADVSQTGPRSVRFTFMDNADRELPLLVAGFLPILSKAWWQGRDFTETTLDHPVASGPYVIDAVDPGRNIVYRRNPNYWGRDLAVSRGQFNLDTIRYDYFRDDSVALEAFKAGDYDYRGEGNAARWATQYDFPALTDGRAVRETIANGTPSGLRALAFNLRRPLFADRRVRQALNLAFDFEWLNRALLHEGYARTSGMFAKSSLAPTGPPSAAELALLEPLRGQVPPEVFGPPFQPAATDGSGRDRTNLRQAAKLLKEAGFKVQDGVLQNANGAPVQFEITLRLPSNERIALAYTRNLKRLGIEARVRLVESAQFQGLIDSYDFDMVFGFWGVTLSPGNEQQNYWSSLTANQPGGRNWAGVSDPAVDAMIDALRAASTREELTAAARALDRILMWNYYVLPLYHDSGQRIAYWRKLSRPETVPVYGVRLETFWATNPR
ncbi:MAG: ABC transporter substrate-binding protein [Alphaproteobacteria bacterium]|nr:ABC transporter substrate-binding protein [Alphaproteobacteria bacterium]